MKQQIKSAAIARFMCVNHFAFSPFSAMEIVKAAPNAIFVRPLSYWILNGYNVDANANRIIVPLPYADFFFLRQGQKTNIKLATKEEKERLYTHDELIEEASYINYAFYDVAHTNCKVRLPKYDLELDALYTLAQQLGLSVEFMPLHKLFLNSYIHNKVIVLPTNNCILHLPLLLKHIAEYILFTTTTQMAEITSFEFFLVQVMLNAVITERIPIYSVPDEDLISVEQQLISLTRVSKLVVYLFTQLNINIKETDSMQLSYIIERKPIQSKKITP